MTTSIFLKDYDIIMQRSRTTRFDPQRIQTMMSKTNTGATPNEGALTHVHKFPSTQTAASRRPDSAKTKKHDNATQTTPKGSPQSASTAKKTQLSQIPMHVLTEYMDPGTKAMYTAAMQNEDPKQAFVNLLMYAHQLTCYVDDHARNTSELLVLRRTNTHFHIKHLLQFKYSGPFQVTYKIPDRFTINVCLDRDGDDITVKEHRRKSHRYMNTFNHSMSLLLRFMDAATMTIPVFELMPGNYMPSNWDPPPIFTPENVDYVMPHMDCIKKSVNVVASDWHCSNSLPLHHTQKRCSRGLVRK